MYSYISRYFLGFVVLQSLSIFALAYTQQWNLEIALLAGALITIVCGMLAERILPFRLDWNKRQNDLKTDLVSAVMIVAVLDPLLKVCGPIVVISMYAYLQLDQSRFLADMPLLSQIIIVTLLIELGRYWAHRIHHAYEPFWWLHAMHHSSRRLYFINNLRFNPLNYGLNFFIGVFPVLLLNPTPLSLLGYLALSQPIVLLQHANIDLKSGWLNYVFSTNELHRWHHSTDNDKANSNFGNALVLWDQVFGTFRIESAKDKYIANVGLFESSRNYPSEAGYLTQIFAAARLLREPKKR